ncbi:hypothetical protein AgCh_029302 [Apium graveolens]
MCLWDDDYSKDISLEAFFDPKNGDEVPLPPTCINQEYKLSELFGDGDEEATLSSAYGAHQYPRKKAILYQALETLCQPDVVRPRITEQQLIDIGVTSKSKAMILLDLSKKYAKAGDDKMPILLSDDMLNDLSDHEIFSRLQGIRGLDAYMAFTIMVFGQEC